MTFDDLEGYQMLEAFQNSRLQKIIECGPMPNVMAALPNIGGAL